VPANPSHHECCQVVKYPAENWGVENGDLHLYTNI
jgi:hypothetical protein